MQIKEIEDWAKPVVDSEVDSEMYSRLVGMYQNGSSFEALQNELIPTHYFMDAVYVESFLATTYFFWRHDCEVHSIFYSCKQMIESGLPLVAMRELTESKEYLKNYANEIRVFYEKVLSTSYGAMNENSAFAILEKAFC